MSAHDSPFIEGTTIQFAWDSVSLTRFLSCPRRYQLSTIEGYVPASENFAIALQFGILFHSALEHYTKVQLEGAKHLEAMNSAVRYVMAEEAYKQLPTEEDIDKIKQQLSVDPDAEVSSLDNSKVRTKYSLIRAIVWYLEHYRNDQMKVVRTESNTPLVEYSFRFPVGIDIEGTEMLYSGHFDRVVQMGEHKMVLDHKTTKSSLGSYYFDQFERSHQMTGYMLAGRVVLNTEVHGAIIDGVALQVGGVQFARHITYRHPEQLTEFMKLLDFVADQVVYLNHRYGSEPWPMNTSACTFCDYKSVCKLAPSMQKHELGFNYKRGEVWNPLANR